MLEFLHSQCLLGVSTTQPLANCRSRHRMWGVHGKLVAGTSSLTKDSGQEGEGTEMDRIDGSRGEQTMAYCKFLFSNVIFVLSEASFHPGNFLFSAQNSERAIKFNLKPFWETWITGHFAQLGKNSHSFLMKNRKKKKRSDELSFYRNVMILQSIHG